MRKVAAVPATYRAVYKSMPLNVGRLSMKQQLTSTQRLVNTGLTESAQGHW